MAAPFAAQVSCRKNFLLSYLTKANRCPFSPVSKYTQAATSQQSQDAPIMVPKKKTRDKLSVLRALASTVEKVSNAPEYRTLDDPMLVPLNNSHKVNNDLAYLGGVRAAKYVMKEYPEPFMVRPLEDNSYTRPGYRFHVEPVHAADTLEGLQERIRMERTSDSYSSYERLLENGVEVPPSLKQDLLELLCFYNSLEPPATPHPLENLHRVQEHRQRRKPHNKWKTNGPADRLFQSLENPDARAYSAMLRGRAKYHDVVNSRNMLAKMKESHLPVSLQDYNAVLSTYVYELNSDAQVAAVKSLLTDMKLNSVEPDLETFNTLLNTVATSRTPRRQAFALDVLKEMKNCGVEPSLTSFHMVVQCFHNSPDEKKSSLFWSIVNELKGKDLTVRDPKDYNFFSDLMSKVGELNDLELVYAVHSLLTHGNNHRLLATTQNTQIYFFQYFSLLFLFEELDKVMEEYNKYVPHTYTLVTDMMQKLLRTVSLHDGHKWIPKLWADNVQNFDSKPSPVIIQCFMGLMAEADVDNEMKAKFLEITENLWNIQALGKLLWTGGILSDMCQVALNAGQPELAWRYCEEYYNNRKSIMELMRPSTLEEMADYLIEAKEIHKLKNVCSILADMVAPNLHKVTEKIRERLDLTAADKSFLDSLDH